MNRRSGMQMNFYCQMTGAALLAAAMLHPVASPAAVTSEDLARLNGDLTPVGAERAGNADEDYCYG